MALLRKALPGRIYWKRTFIAPFESAPKKPFWEQVDVITVDLANDLATVTFDFGAPTVVTEREFAKFYAKRSGDKRK
jgi:NRPS condensation-like uncharacterized protein